MEIEYEIIEQIGVLLENEKGWKKELNLISWNKKEPKFDLREWPENHDKIGKCVTLSKEEVLKLGEIIKTL